jgi:hypothetical protein
LRTKDRRSGSLHQDFGYEPAGQPGIRAKRTRIFHRHYQNSVDIDETECSKIYRRRISQSVLSKISRIFEGISFESRSIYHHVIIIVVVVSSGRNIAPRLERTLVDNGRSDARTQNFGPTVFDEFHLEIIASVFGFRYGF